MHIINFYTITWLIIECYESQKPRQDQELHCSREKTPVKSGAATSHKLQWWSFHTPSQASGVKLFVLILLKSKP